MEMNLFIHWLNNNIYNIISHISIGADFKNNFSCEYISKVCNHKF